MIIIWYIFEITHNVNAQTKCIWEKNSRFAWGGAGQTVEEGLSLAQTTEWGVIVSHLCPLGGGRALGRPGQPSSLLGGGRDTIALPSPQPSVTWPSHPHLHNSAPSLRSDWDLIKYMCVGRNPPYSCPWPCPRQPFSLYTSHSVHSSLGQHKYPLV